MITEEQLRDLFEEWTGIHLTLDHGDVKCSYREINDVVTPLNGVMSIDAWTFTPVRTVAMATTQATATVVARNDEEADNITAHINDALQAVRGTTVIVRGEDGKAIKLAVMPGTAYRDETLHGVSFGEGDECDVVVNISYIATANGVNSADTVLIIDGEQIEVENVTSGMTSATDEHPGDDGITTTAVPSKTFHVECGAVLLDNEAGKILTKEGLDLDNISLVHCVEYTIGSVTRFYMMVFTQCQIGSSEMNNVGASFALATANPDTMHFDARWNTTTAVGMTASIGSEAGAVVFWGDNTASRVGDSGMVSHVYTDGVNEHTIRIFGAYNAPITRSLRIGDNLSGKRLIYVGEDWDTSGEPDMTVISCEQSRLAIESGYLRELRDDDTPLVSVGYMISNGTEWRTSLDVVTGIRDESLWHVYVAEMGV